MSFTISKSSILIEKALDARSVRQDLISGNIANIDTPFYKARDIDFETVLAQKSREIYAKGETQELKMAQTNKIHMDGAKDFNSSMPTVYFRDGHMARNDGNTVDLDVESTELGKNAMMYNALTYALQKNSILFRSVIESSAKV
ncbi:MAG: flagellar basal body rod protein FlgB [Sulfurospirillaceae bacterium]|nr:flagellar basal body rod protein FlgB [Sulfurospirillaceae bacterium]MDD3462883.1 flagellar basal body rod protein FlgB [Sulfurospirillaceae bacterium]